MIHLRIVAPEKVAHQALEVLSASPAVLNIVHLHGAAQKPEGDVILCDVARPATLTSAHSVLLPEARGRRNPRLPSRRPAADALSPSPTRAQDEEEACSDTRAAERARNRSTPRGAERAPGSLPRRPVLRWYRSRHARGDAAPGELGTSRGV